MKKVLGIISAAIFTAVLGLAASAASLPPPAGYTSSQLIFEETFTSPTLDTTKWNPWMGDDRYGRWGDQGKLPAPYSGMNCSTNCSGPTDYSIPYYDPYPYGYGTMIDRPHLVGGNGNLKIIASPSNHFSNLGYKWASAGISTHGKAWVPATGGYVQWHAKMPDSRYGAWAALWMLSTNGAEVDMQESGYPRGTSNVNNMLANGWHGAGSQQNIVDVGFDLSAAYHTYGLEYLPGKAWNFYLDGKLMTTFTSNVPTNAAYEVIIDMEFANNNGVTLPWHTASDPVNHPGPFELNVDNVQIYSLPSTTPPPPTGDTTPPTTPSGLKTTSVTATEVNLAWTASTDAGGGIVYDIWRNGTYLGYSVTPSYTDTTVVSGTTYNYQVLAYDAAKNTSPLSTGLSVKAGTTTTTDTTAPISPSNVAITLNTPIEVDLTWTASTDNVGVTGYRVLRNGSVLATTTSTSYADKSVGAALVYSYQIQAYDAAGNYSNSATVSVTTPTFGEGAAVTMRASTPVMSRAGRGATVCTQPAGTNGTILSDPQTVKGVVWWYVGFVANCEGWVPQSSLSLN